ncbi:MAG: tRNA pseudouridine(55) synthase TruB [Candidatus Omnitrophica bacterium]|nr:tRNA pseudouridine(55) synthase TruB [Candidatus Omnitrophota bacterium]
MDGILVVDKDKGWTSHDVCALIRSRFKLAKVGHGGTLDPLATGVLIILLGRATKLFESVAATNKQYLGTMRLGIKTDSHDWDGKVLGEADWKGVTAEQVESVFQTFRGEITQKPPMISALKHKGVRLYKLARQGKTVERIERPITVYQLEVKATRFPEVDFFAHVSKGTYLRTLVHDIGEALGCFATLAALRRVRSGDFSIEESVTIPELKQMDIRELGRHVRMKSFAFAS